MAQLRNPELELVPASSSIGAEVLGADLATPLTDSIFKKIRNSLCEWGVLFFKKQNLTPEDHVRLGRYFGELHVSKTITKVRGYPLIAEVRKEPKQKRNIEENGTPTTASLPNPHWVQFWLLANYQKLVVILCLLTCHALLRSYRGACKRHLDL